MTKLMRFILFFTIIFAVFGYTVQEQAKDLISGQEWRGLSEETKMGYLIGFEEGLVIAQTAVIIEKIEIEEESAESVLLDRIENWIETYKVGSTLLKSKVSTADTVFESEANQAIMVAAVLPLVSKMVRGEISNTELTDKLEQLRDVLKNEGMD